MVMVVYDVTSETSFNSCAKWLERVRSHNHDVSIPGVYLFNVAVYNSSSVSSACLWLKPCYNSLFDATVNRANCKP